jgi:bifunctional DNA-binding transcriptional regulator/antitoxin component of YhaV-PrlF toxin-antitoxin module
MSIWDLDYARYAIEEYEEGKSLSTIRRKYGIEKRYYLWVRNMGQGNDFFIVSKSKRTLLEIKRELKSIVKNFRNKLKEIESSDEEYPTNLDEEFSLIVDGVLEYYKDDIEIFPEDSRNYYNFRNDLMIVSGKDGIYFVESVGSLDLF